MSGGADRHRPAPGRLGFSGRVARLFLHNQLTPLLALTGVLLGLFAFAITPREEEPQIDVTFANVLVGFPGASAAQVESLVATPMEKVLSEITGVDHIYSSSQPGLAVLGVQFKVGQHRTDAIVRLYNAIYSHQDWRPANAGILPPLVKPKGIDDVPVVTLTLWTRDPARGGRELGEVAHTLESQLVRIPGVRSVDTIGATPALVRVKLDPQKLAGFGVTVQDLSRALLAANLVEHAGALVSGGTLTPVDAGAFLARPADVAGLVVAVRDGHPVYLYDVADVALQPEQPDSYVWIGTGPGAAKAGVTPVAQAPAVTIAIAKKPGANAIAIARQVTDRMQQLRGLYVPAGVEVTVTRNYGATADAKATKLIEKLMFATASVVLLVLLSMGRREAVVVGTAVVVTLAMTLFASWAWGFTINRVSLFALIFSIGILVDDAIVVVENIHRHARMEGADPATLVPEAVDEVGGPTILATLTVIAALLPMAFVSGLMGPYMSPIPINASMGMMISLAVALVFTPWLSRVLLLRGGHGHGPRPAAAQDAAMQDEALVQAGLATPAPAGAAEARREHAAERHLAALFERFLRPFLHPQAGRARRHRLYWGILAAIVLAMGLAVVKLVVLKMLPFDNKSEFQVVVDLPQGSPVQTTARLLGDLTRVLQRVPEVSDYEVYAGTAAPINFNGLVRQYYLRQDPRLGDIQVNLVDKSDRHRSSHQVALAVRPALAAVARGYGATLQVVEVPPGPPVRAPLVAEVYGPRYDVVRQTASALRGMFDTAPGVVDVGDSVEAPARRLQVEVDRTRAALRGVSQEQVVQALATALQGTDVTYVHSGSELNPIPVRLELPAAGRGRIEGLLALEVRSATGERVPLSELVHVREAPWDGAIYHKDLLPVAYVTGDVAGGTDSPLYGMFALVSRVAHHPPGGLPVAQWFTRQPQDPGATAIKWDGEWQITYETFRDMGIAYSAGLVLIYLLVVAQFGSYALPLIIMAPVPLTLIGVMPGHALLRDQFTATSMIGMIALAGIIVRNSILLVDFIDRQRRAGAPLEDAVVLAATVRARPIALTALAAMIGAMFILDDPIFNGLAVALIFGIFVATVLTLIVIPVLYYAYLHRKQAHPALED